MNDLTVEDVELKIDQEFEECLPKHSESESKELKLAVEKDGEFLDPILYWQETIIDGHHRFKLWKSLPEDTQIPPPKVRKVQSIKSREDALEWIKRHQLGRRNLDPQKRALFIGRLYNKQKLKIPNENGKKVNTAKDIAGDAGISERSVQRLGKFEEALALLGQVNPKFQNDVETGDLRVSQADIISTAKLEREDLGKAIANMRNGRKWNDGIKSAGGREKKNALSKPQALIYLEQCDRVLGEAGSAYYNATNEDAEIPRERFDDAMLKLVAVVREHIGRQRNKMKTK